MTDTSAMNALIDEYGRADTAPLGTPGEFQQRLAAVRAEMRAALFDENAACSAESWWVVENNDLGHWQPITARLRDRAAAIDRRNRYRARFPDTDVRIVRHTTHATVEEVDDA